MARSTFGGFGGDQVSLDPAGNSGFYKAAANYNAIGTFWSAATGGTQYTDLVDPTTSVALAGVSTDAHGHVVPFKGPNGITEGWLDFSNGLGTGRFKVTAIDAGLYQTATGLDSASANLVNTSGSATDIALKAGYAPKTGSAEYATKPKTGKNALTGWFHISGYAGADPTGATSSQTAVAACFADAAAYVGATMNSIQAVGPTIYVDGQYLLTAALTPPTKATIRGNGRELSLLFNNTTDLFSWTTGTGLTKVTFKDVALETGSTGGHIINVDGDSTAYLTQSLFLNCILRTRNTASSIVRWRTGAQFIGNVFDQCELDVQAGHTNPAFDMLVTSGNVINSNVWKNSWCQGHSTTTAPFFYLECNNGGYLYNNAFRDLVGEQNGGGFIHLYANAGFVVENCPDWDMGATAYANHVYKFAQGTGQTSYSYGKIENSFRLANSGGLGASIYDIYAVGDNNSSTKHELVRIINCDPPGAILACNLNGSAQIEGLTRAYRVITTTQTLDDTCPDVIVCNSASAISVTLPNATAAKNGRRITVKNVGAGTVTIPTTVDGVANSTLAQWASKNYMTDGINAALGRIWFTV